MKTTPKPSQIAILAGAVVLLIFSFLNFYKSSFGDVGFSAWDGDLLFPLTIFPLLLGLIVGGTTAATLFADVKLPEQILTLNWKQINFTLSFAAVLILLGLLISAPSGSDLGAGLLVSVLGGIALVAGSVMELLGIEVGGTTGGGGSNQAPGGPSTPF